MDVGFGEWAPAALRSRVPAGTHARSTPGREDVLKRGTRIGAIVGGLAAFVPAVWIYSDRMRARRDCPVDDEACVDKALTRNAVGALLVVVGTGAGAGTGLALGAGLAHLRWRLTQRRALPDQGGRGCAEPSRRAAFELVDLAPTPNTDRGGSACLPEAR
ncbi:MAG: hypothetical protein D6761_00585 [Candidatus Dadabacteria bacterium]|nr:MAG: hypothetical protein D6761_00585 [Candidatus Dadabacteria bacterium]